MFFRYNLLGLIWALIILIFTLMPGQSMPTIHYLFSFDKVAHTLVFCIEVFLLTVGFLKQYSFQFFRENASFLAIALSIIYGIAIEFFQSIVPNRDLELADVFFDSLGCLIGWGLFFVVYKLEV